MRLNTDGTHDTAFTTNNATGGDGNVRSWRVGPTNRSSSAGTSPAGTVPPSAIWYDWMRSGIATWFSARTSARARSTALLVPRCSQSRCRQTRGSSSAGTSGAGTPIAGSMPLMASSDCSRRAALTASSAPTSGAQTEASCTRQRSRRTERSSSAGNSPPGTVTPSGTWCE